MTTDRSGRCAATSRGYRKVREGLVVSDKMDKTVVVEVEDRVQAPAVRQGHPPHQAGTRRTTTRTPCGVGDRVLLMETRPLSATKRWRVVADSREGQVRTTRTPPGPRRLA